MVWTQSSFNGVLTPLTKRGRPFHAAGHNMKLSNDRPQDMATRDPYHDLASRHAAIAHDRVVDSEIKDVMLRVRMTVSGIKVPPIISKPRLT